MGGPRNQVRELDTVVLQLWPAATGSLKGSSHKCVQDFGRSQPNGARIRLGFGVRDPVAQGVTVADSTAACAGPALGGGLLGGSFSNRTVLIRKHLREVSVRAC